MQSRGICRGQYSDKKISAEFNATPIEVAKDNKIDETESENNHDILKDEEGHSTQAGEKTGDVKNNEEEGDKTKK